MSQENVEIVRQALDAFNSGMEDWIAFYDSEATLHDPPNWIEHTVHSGHHGIRRAVSLWTDNFSEFGWDIERLIDLDDRVVALLEQRGRIKGAEGWVEQPVGFVYDLRDTKIVRLAIYLSWAEALDAVGQSG
jgi:ketosteroid isomerase-like protein